MSLRDELKTITGNKRRFLLLRITDMGTETARQLVGITKGTYNSWCQNPQFVELYRRRDEFSSEYKQEAIQLLRRDNQLAAVLLESKLIQKMKEEIDSGEYELIRTNLAKEVYSKLINDLDYQPQVANLTWEQRVANFYSKEGRTPQVEGGVDAITETTGVEETEHQTSNLLTEGEQASQQV